MLVSLLQIRISIYSGSKVFVKVPAGMGLANQGETSYGWTPSNEGISETRSTRMKGILKIIRSLGQDRSWSGIFETVHNPSA